MIVFTGHDRSYTLPRGLQASGHSRVSAWDVLSLAQCGDEWAESVVAGMIQDSLPAGEYMATVSPDSEDVLVELLRQGEGGIEVLLSDGSWTRPSGIPRTTCDIDPETAEALRDAVLADAHLAIKYYSPVAWLPPSNEYPLTPLAAAGPDDSGWHYYAVVDDLDHGAVLDLIRMARGPVLEAYQGEEEGWLPDKEILADLRGITPPLLVELNPQALERVQTQVDEYYIENPRTPKDDAAVAAALLAGAPTRGTQLGGKIQGGSKSAGSARRRRSGPGASGWEEEEHPRDGSGMFSAKSSSDSDFETSQPGKGGDIVPNQRPAQKHTYETKKTSSGKSKSKGSSKSKKLAAKKKEVADTRKRVNRLAEQTKEASDAAKLAKEELDLATEEVRGNDSPEARATMEDARKRYAAATERYTERQKKLEDLRKRLKSMTASAVQDWLDISAEGLSAAVSPDPRAEKLRRYWSIGGKGGLKIRWGMPGDWRRCVRQLTKYMGPRAKGYCQNLHKRNTGVWTGSKLNASAVSIEEAIAAALASKLWANETNKESTMLTDGEYTETDTDAATVALLAGGFPVAPPDEWFEDPKLSGPTPISVGDDGRVSGHIATFDVAHIGMPGNVRAPKSRSQYAYFHTGDLVTASGAHVSVGQLTLAGGHAPLNADAGKAVEHYDDTASAVADIRVGEDRYGIWAAGAVRPDATPEQLRTLRASAPSGDWRPINGGLELVAICQVNVPGFPVARARVASGMVTALVAAGARPLAEAKLIAMADSSVQARLTQIEAALVASTESADMPLVEDVPQTEVVEMENVEVEGVEVESAPPATDNVVRLREELRAGRMEALRARVKGAPIAASAARESLRSRVHGASSQ